MKRLLSLLTTATLVTGISQAHATDGQVDDATLAALGLGGMQRLSDSDGLQVRGLSSSASSGGGSLVIAFFSYNKNGSTTGAVATDTNSSRSTDENAGLGRNSYASHHQGSRVKGSFGPVLINGHKVFEVKSFDLKAGTAASYFAGSGHASAN